jgi:quercetin dioxygenase-like cupin family protein
MNLPLKPEDCEAYQFPTGKIYIGPSTREQSMGFLELKPSMSLDKHNRPVEAKLTQIFGSCQIELYDPANQIKVVKLEPGSTLTIPANQFHIHANKDQQSSLTFWQFDGDVTSIINDLRTQGIKLS